jgi:DNA-binding HxlR family transcriptional regulator
MFPAPDVHDEQDPFGPDEVQCPIREMLARAGGRWTLDVVIALKDETRHFGDIVRAIPGVSRRMLVVTLRGMERDGLITRTGTSSTGERVFYALTELGVELCEHFRAMARWSQRNRETIYAARERYDATARMPVTF